MKTVEAPESIPEPIIPLRELERRAAINALRVHGVVKAAEALGIGKTTLYRMMDRYGIKRPSVSGQ